MKKNLTVLILVLVIVVAIGMVMNAGNQQNAAMTPEATPANGIVEAPATAPTAPVVVETPVAPVVPLDVTPSPTDAAPAEAGNDVEKAAEAIQNEAQEQQIPVPAPSETPAAPEQPAPAATH